MPAEILQNSSFLDYTSYGTVPAGATVDSAYGITNVVGATNPIHVALILPRANDPTPLLQSDWATRQATIASMNDGGTLWSTYGATTADYAATVDAVNQVGGTVLGTADGSDGYVTSQASRTIWVSLTPPQFQTLFGQPLLSGDFNGGTYPFWRGDLSLPDGLRVSGLWFDIGRQFGIFPASSDLSGLPEVTLHGGAQSVGSQISLQTNVNATYAGDIADWYYHFPLAGQPVQTATIGLVEPGIGDAIGNDRSNSFQAGLDAFRAAAGSASPGSYYVVNGSGESYYNDNSNPVERSLDVGVIASAAPGSRFGLYVGSGYTDVNDNGNGTNSAVSHVFTAYQGALWDLVNDPAVISSSFSNFQQVAPGSPFYEAVKELITDAALRNISLLVANNDFGSSYELGNGLANQLTPSSFPYELMVGGTSLTTLAVAPHDPTISGQPAGHSLLELAMAGDRATLWPLIAAGLQSMPASDVTDPNQVTFLESVWNTYASSGTSFNLTRGLAGGGGVSTVVPTPDYQAAFGLVPNSVNPGGGTGRGVPDVSADAGGNLTYAGPSYDLAIPSSPDAYTGNDGYYGTSASTPLWASLTAQLDTVFADQGLPRLGYFNDLLYIAAAVVPASFNDITVGNNVSSYFEGGPINGGPDYGRVTLTGLGYQAGPGYDLVTGLGTPNGMVLARTLTAIAHAQTSFASEPPVLTVNASGGHTSPVSETLLVQTSLGMAGSVQIGPVSFDAQPADPYAWTSRMAGQALQPGFDPTLDKLFDRDGHGTEAQVHLAAGQDVTVAINGQILGSAQGSLTAPYGFMDFVSADGTGTVRLARAVAVAETAGGQNDQTVVVRVAQNGGNSETLMFYRVDDMAGTIDHLAPGDAGYAAAALARAFTTGTGGTSVAAPGYGNPARTDTLSHVNAGDLIAMKLTSNGQDFYGFAGANEVVGGHPVNHLWNYGMNTWGFEDLPGGSDHDFNDVIVNLDFTSAAGHAYLV